MLLGYADGSGLDTRWVVLDGDESFFRITKRLHNRLHGMAGDSGALDRAAAAHYGAVSAANVTSLSPWVRPNDIVILHDPQTAGLAGLLAERGARVVWRCHIGTDRTNAFTEEAWAFLRPTSSAVVPTSSRTADSFPPPTRRVRRLDHLALDRSLHREEPSASRSMVVSLLDRIGLVDDDSPTRTARGHGPNPRRWVPSGGRMVWWSRYRAGTA